ncbi:hypothetical protein ACFWYA_05715 [Streptomyces sp. NPDC059011]|uniref:hypothetical protein n=1 Tax=unclassified Streptomyces TaxID=2593676 RepID=UPI003681A08A
MGEAVLDRRASQGEDAIGTFEQPQERDEATAELASHLEQMSQLLLRAARALNATNG